MNLNPHSDRFRSNLLRQAELCREAATITRDDDLAAEWNETAAEIDAIIQVIGGRYQVDVAHPVD